MAGLFYFIALPFIYLLSLLPFPLFYGVCDLLFVILYYVVGYRKKVSLQNLRNSFPEKSEKEIRRICHSFYHYLCDLFLETFKTLTISKASMIKRCALTPAATALFDRYYSEGKSIVLVMGHFGNWEWAGNTFSLLGKHQLYVVYHPLANKHFNDLVYKMRTRFGTKLIDMKETFRDMVKNRPIISITAFIADQTPSAPGSAYWTRFLNQDTPVFRGTEKIARKMNYPVVYATVKRIKQGYYEIHAETLVEHPKNTNDGEISELHTRKLEKDIIEQPEIWLWTHRRWKHTKPE
jgi:Kdo2-lipid IVA lauroyltransferase/acyltransferase